MSTVSDVQAMLAMELDELALLLAEGAAADQFGSSEPSKDETKRLGMTMFKESLRKLRPFMCHGNSVIPRLANAEETQIIAVVSDFVITACGGLPVSVVTAMVLKYGVSRLCSHE